MKFHNLTLLFCFITVYCIGQNKLGAIGQWREQYANYNVQQLVLGDQLYGASKHQVFSLNASNEISLLGKSNGLHEIGIAQIAWDKTQSQLIIAYNNSSIDIKQGDQVYLINDLTLSNLYAAKKINHILVQGNWAFLSTNFGIVVIDLIQHEIKDTWFPNNNRQITATYQCSVLNDSLYALTENGLMVCPLKNNWIVNNQWQNKSSYNGLGLTKLHNYNGAIYLYNTYQIFKSTQANVLLTLTNGSIQKLSNDKIGLLLATKNNNKGNVLRINTTSIIDSSELIAPVDILENGAGILIADSLKGLLAHSDKNTWINLGGPLYNINGMATIDENNLIAPYATNNIGFGVYNEAGWHHYTQINNSLLPVLNSSAINPKDGSYWLGGTNQLIHYTADFQKTESIILNNNKGSIRSIDFSKAGNGWALQDQQGLYQQQNNSWTNIAAPTNFTFSGVYKMIANQQAQAWIIAPNNQGLYIYQSPNYFTTAFWKQLTTNSNNGNLPSSKVTSLAEDATGAIWVGTDNGIGIFQCGDISKEACNAFIPTVSNNGFNGYLFQKETVNSIAVDGANRKWIGTNNGAWLLSPDGYEILEHFIQKNSPIPNDTVLQIKIAPISGEVFFMTANQMVSYRGTATKGAEFQNKISIFPNPVAPDYNGIISIRGLIENAIVKITDLNGKLVFQTRALGGQAVWNGKTYEGNKPASGVYLVFVRDDTGNEKGIGKIVLTKGR
jgi:ligand-binding sensor domain-containing protein